MSTNKAVISLALLGQYAGNVAQSIVLHVPNIGGRPWKLWGVPRGGIAAALLVAQHLYNSSVVDNIEDCDIIIDDLIDSGATRDRYAAQYPEKPFYALIDKTIMPNAWIVFPWEQTDQNADESVTDNFTRILQYIGEDATREGLLETPARVAKAWTNFWASGYGKNPADILKVFEDGAGNYNEMVTVQDIPIYSHCEHHLAPIFGTVTISYIPNGKIVGLSKLSRLADMFARRLQVQERLTVQIADALMEHLQPLGCGVVIKARHMCMESRGICQQGHQTITTALRGEFSRAEVRAEFLSYTK